MNLSKGSSALAVLRAQFVFRIAGAEVGSLPRVRGAVTIRNRGRLVVGRHLLLDTRAYPSQLSVGSGGHLRIGDDVFINQGADISAADLVQIGDRVLLGPRVTVVDDSAHDISPAVVRRVAAVTIADDVWLGRGCMVLPGVSIGRFSVVGAGAVVTHDVPPCSVVAGVPARVVRSFPEPPATFRR